MAETERPADMETKDTRGTLLGYIPSVVPHISRSGSELTDDERARADARLRNNDMTGVPEAEHRRAQFSELGVTSESGGTQEAPAAGSTETVTPPAKRPRS